MHSDITRVQLNQHLTDDQIVEMIRKRTHLDESHYDRIVTATEIGVKPDGSILYMLLKNRLSFGLCKRAYPLLLRAAAHRVPGGTRAIAAGAHIERLRKVDGTLGKRFGVPDLPHLKGSKDGIVGYYDTPDCRETAFTKHHWERFAHLVPFTQAVDRVFRQYMPDRWQAQLEVARHTPNFRIERTSFSTVTVNRNFRTALHTDEGDLKEGFGVITCMNAGRFTGGELCFPKYRTAIRFGTQDVLLCDVHEAHGNLAIVGEEGKYNRVSCVFYYREGMKKCAGRKP